MYIGWIWAGHIQTDVLEPLNPSVSAIGGLWNGPKGPPNAINEAYGTMSCPGGPKLMVMRVYMLDLVGTHPG